ncbi:hypothetical protein BH23PLA1_BH23PLA1_11150 [soil metagenome]
MAALRNAAIGWLRYTVVTNIAASLRRNTARVTDRFAKLGILKQKRALSRARLEASIQEQQRPATRTQKEPRRAKAIM